VKLDASFVYKSRQCDDMYFLLGWHLVYNVIHLRRDTSRAIEQELYDVDKDSVMKLLL